MIGWRKVHAFGRPLWVNLDTACIMERHELDTTTTVTWPSHELEVEETPEEMFNRIMPTKTELERLGN